MKRFLLTVAAVALLGAVVASASAPMPPRVVSASSSFALIYRGESKELHLVDLRSGSSRAAAVPFTADIVRYSAEESTFWGVGFTPTADGEHEGVVWQWPVSGNPTYWSISGDVRRWIALTITSSERFAAYQDADEQVYLSPLEKKPVARSLRRPIARAALRHVRTAESRTQSKFSAWPDLPEAGTELWWIVDSGDSMLAMTEGGRLFEVSTDRVWREINVSPKPDWLLGMTYDVTGNRLLVLADFDLADDRTVAALWSRGADGIWQQLAPRAAGWARDYLMLTGPFIDVGRGEVWVGITETRGHSVKLSLYNVGRQEAVPLEIPAPKNVGEPSCD